MSSVKHLPPGFCFKALYCYYDESSAKHHYKYVPLEIILAKINGKPDVSLTLSEEGAIFQWGSTLLSADQPLLQALKNEAANHFDVAPDKITLSAADINPKVALRVASDPAKYETLAIDLSKGLSEILSATEKPHALAAINGRENELQLEYSYNLTLQTHLQYHYEDDINPILIDIIHHGANDSLASCTAFIKTALESGEISVSKTQVNEPTPQLQQQVKEEFCALFGKIAFPYVDGTNDVYDLPNPCDQTIDYGKGEPRQYPTTVCSDVATWLKGYNPGDFVHHSNTPIPNPKRPSPVKPTEQTLQVSVNFKPSDYQISSIELVWGSDEIKMPWNYAPTTVKNKTSEALKVIVKYFFAGSYTTELPYTGKDWVITPQDAGLCQITLDATALSEHNKQVVGSLTYHPDGAGRKHTENFTFPTDNQWQLKWYVVSLKPDLGGYLDGSYTTTSKWWGKKQSHEINQTSTPQLTLKE